MQIGEGKRCEFCSVCVHMQTTHFRAVGNRGGEEVRILFLLRTHMQITHIWAVEIGEGKRCEFCSFCVHVCKLRTSGQSTPEVFQCEGFCSFCVHICKLRLRKSSPRSASMQQIVLCLRIRMQTTPLIWRGKIDKSWFFTRKTLFFNTQFASKLEVFDFSSEIQHFWNAANRTSSEK